MKRKEGGEKNMVCLLSSVKALNIIVETLCSNFTKNIVRLHMDYCKQFWLPHYRMDVVHWRECRGDSPRDVV